jgi:hypothetical protein
MGNPKLSLEILNGPLDGHVETLESETDWSKEGEGSLSFPWDEELGTPQARFFVEDGKWWLKVSSTRRSTRHNMEPIEDKAPLGEGDLLKAANTWLLVNGAE